ncbi:MAG: DUF928 domain-containing protein [Pleurocapsa sp.]
MQQEQSNQSPSKTSESRRVDFKPPDYEGDAPSGRTRGTASRGCSLARSDSGEGLEISALIPSDSRGLTGSESPTIWLDVSYNQSKMIGKKVVGEFSLEEVQTNKKILPKRTKVTLPSNSGFFSIPIPQSLESNKWYRWYLVLDCNFVSSSNSNSILSLEGLVKRVELPELKHQLKTQSVEEKISIYAQQGLWYDALNETAQLSCNQPDNPYSGKVWAILLKEIGLDSISQKLPQCKNQF